MRIRNPLNRLMPQVRKRVRALGNKLVYRPSQFGFVSGSYRSGTTAMADWLGQQPGVASFSESRLMIAAHAMFQEVHRFRSLDRNKEALTAEMRQMLFRHYARQMRYRANRILIDKEPLGPIALPERNYGEFLASVRAIFPDVRLIMMSRDPIPTLWSMSQRDYGHSLVERRVHTFSLEEHIANWCATADLILELAGQSDVCVCRFERLTAEPEAESQRIARFLGLRRVRPFAPRPTKEPAFTEDELGLIREHTSQRSEALIEACEAELNMPVAGGGGLQLKAVPGR